MRSASRAYSQDGLRVECLQEDSGRVSETGKTSESAMNVSTSGAIESDPVLRQRIAHATQLLEQIIGVTSQFVTAEWGLAHDASGLQLIQLALSDFTGARVEARFAPEELNH